MMKIALTVIVLFISGYQVCSAQESQLQWKKKKIQHFNFYYTSKDDSVARNILKGLKTGTTEVEKYFDHSFKSKFEAYIFPNRKLLNKKWQEVWEMPDFQSECWMVASGGGSGLRILSPNVWKTDACEHNPSDTEHVRKLILHELVHVYQSQYSPDPKLNLEPIGWFVEGVATLVSGQLDQKRLDQVKQAIKDNKTPAQLENFWSGKARYGQSGYMVAFIKEKYGINMVFDLLSFTDEQAILNRLNLTEEQLINSWKEYVESL